LDTIETLVAAVTMLSLVVFRKGRIALKVGAGQIIEQHVQLCIEQILLDLPRFGRRFRTWVSML
jgi:hypothetical protein